MDESLVNIFKKKISDGRLRPDTRGRRAAEFLSQHEVTIGELTECLIILCEVQDELSSSEESKSDRLKEAESILSYGMGDWLRDADSTISALIRMCMKGTAAQVDPSRSQKKEFKELIERIQKFNQDQD